jgi:hypothetical protein
MCYSVHYNVKEMICAIVSTTTTRDLNLLLLLTTTKHGSQSTLTGKNYIH